MSINPRIIIIGAGASGYAAACKLLEFGFTNIKILEAGNRIGGRINSVEFGSGMVDLGAQWCHGEKNNTVHEMVKNVNLLQPSVCDFTEFLFVDSQGNFVDSNVSGALINLLSEISEDTEELKLQTGSFGDYVTKKYDEKLSTDFPNIDRRIAKQIMDWFHKFTNNLNASANWCEVSAKGLTEYEECEGNQCLNWKDKGYRIIFSVLRNEIPDASKKLPVDEKIIFNKEVTKILWDDKKNNTREVLVECADGSKFVSDHVILTVSLGVLKEMYKTLFVPEVPLFKKNAIQGLSIGVVDKIILKFPKRWWPDEFTTGIELIWTEDDSQKLLVEFTEGPRKDGKSWLESFFGFHPIDGNPTLLLAFVNGELAPEIESVPDEIVLQGCMYLLKRFLGKHFDILQPDAILRSSWYRNKYFRGSYSFHSMEADKLKTNAAELAKPLGDNALLFAGEATHSFHYSTVHGAIESGFREANRVLAHYKLDTTKKKKNIAIIGAGMAGLAATLTLLQSGFEEILLLEAQDKPGGRIHSLKIGPSYIDLGAQWLHGDKNALWKISQRHNLISPKTVYEGRGIFLREDGFKFDNFLVEKVDFIVGEILEECENFVDFTEVPRSVGTYLEKKFREYLDENLSSPEEKLMYLELFDWHIRFQVIDNCCDSLYNVSAKFWGRYFCPTSEGQAHINYSNGHESVVDILVDQLPKNVLRTNCPVINIEWRKENCEKSDKTCGEEEVHSENLMGRNGSSLIDSEIKNQKLKRHNESSLKVNTFKLTSGLRKMDENPGTEVEKIHVGLMNQNLTTEVDKNCENENYENLTYQNRSSTNVNMVTVSSSFDRKKIDDNFKQEEVLNDENFPVIIENSIEFICNNESSLITDVITFTSSLDKIKAGENPEKKIAQNCDKKIVKNSENEMANFSLDRKKVDDNFKQEEVLNDENFPVTIENSVEFICNNESSLTTDVITFTYSLDKIKEGENPEKKIAQNCDKKSAKNSENEMANFSLDRKKIDDNFKQEEVLNDENFPVIIENSIEFICNNESSLTTDVITFTSSLDKIKAGENPEKKIAQNCDKKIAKNSENEMANFSLDRKKVDDNFKQEEMLNDENFPVTIENSIEFICNNESSLTTDVITFTSSLDKIKEGENPGKKIAQNCDKKSAKNSENEMANFSLDRKKVDDNFKQEEMLNDENFPVTIENSIEFICNNESSLTTDVITFTSSLDKIKEGENPEKKIAQNCDKKIAKNSENEMANFSLDRKKIDDNFKQEEMLNDENFPVIKENSIEFICNNESSLITDVITFTSSLDKIKEGENPEKKIAQNCDKKSAKNSENEMANFSFDRKKMDDDYKHDMERNFANKSSENFRTVKDNSVTLICNKETDIVTIMSSLDKMKVDENSEKKVVKISEKETAEYSEKETVKNSEAERNKNSGTKRDKNTRKGKTRGVKLTCENGSTFEVDAVIVTSSLGVLKNRSKTLFTPNLPQEISEIIDSMGFAGICKIFLLFSEKWWTNEEGFQLIWNYNCPYEDKNWVRYLSGFDPVLDQPNMLLGWIGGRGAEIVEAIPEEEIGKECAEVLRRFTGNLSISDPVKVVRSRWLSNPWILGGYSHTTPKCDNRVLLPENLQKPLRDENGVIRVLLAGEHTHPEHFSTTHGAYESGIHQAKILLAEL